MLADRTVEIMQFCTDSRVPGSIIAWSNQVNRAILINDFLSRQMLPDFDDDEWGVILNVYVDTTGVIENPPYSIASDLMDSLGLIDVQAHPHTELVKRIHTMNQADQFAILSFVEKYWHNSGSEMDFDKIKTIIMNNSGEES